MEHACMHMVNPAKQQISVEKWTNTLDKWMIHFVCNIHN